MTLEDIYTVLIGTGLPVVYRAWPTDPARNLPPPLPWICYMETPKRPFVADGVAYYSSLSISVELYTKNKDPQSERAVEQALTTAGVCYVKDETYLDSESCYEITYEIEV